MHLAPLQAARAGWSLAVQATPGQGRRRAAGACVSTLGTQYDWRASQRFPGKNELFCVGEKLPLCGEQLECGSTCCLAPSHAGGCSCVGDDEEPGDCPA